MYKQEEIQAKKDGLNSYTKCKCFPQNVKKMGLVSLTALLPALASANQVNATFLVQLKEYKGDEAFWSMYLVDPQGRYVKTLWVSGEKPQFYKEMPRWWKYLGRKPQDLNAITGASTPAGDRQIVHLKLDDKYLKSGYSVRVETAVENQQNYDNDVETTLAPEHQGEKIAGTGYVRYLRYKWD